MRNTKPVVAKSDVKQARAQKKPAVTSVSPPPAVMKNADALTMPTHVLQAVKAYKIGNTTKLAASDKAQARTPRSDAFEAIHSAAAALHCAGVIDKTTMREFDESCFKPPSFTACDVLRIRNKEHLSQAVLARYMGITKSTVVKWESADNIPSPMAQRLLKVIDEQGINAIV